MHPDTKFRQFQVIGFLNKGIKGSCEPLMDELSECRKGYLIKAEVCGVTPGAALKNRKLNIF